MEPRDNLPADSLSRFNLIWSALGGPSLDPVQIQTIGTIALNLTEDEVDVLVALIRAAIAEAVSKA